MNGSKKELDERIAETQRMLKAMEESLARTKRMIEEARKILDGAKEGAGDGEENR
jgi:peptidoglycan hydrolase CwlO-like protein